MSEWISADERLPEVYESMLVFMPESGQHVLNVSYNEVHKKYEWDFPDKWINACDDDVTHWMPLPQQPEE